MIKGFESHISSKQNKGSFEIKFRIHFAIEQWICFPFNEYLELIIVQLPDSEQNKYYNGYYRISLDVYTEDFA
jgi:hypothetical protein